ncbi:hypothetical protein BJ944DRAFT_239460 [Cunninghamella echinulata]|nr:hypothetical protein BJ944DRAFT_239460 [Cunninghamella echinulata]
MLIRCSIAIYTFIQSLATGKKTTMNPATTTKPSAVTPPPQLASTLTPTTNTIKRFEPNFQSSSLEKSSSLTTAAADSSPFVNKLIPSTEQLSKEGYAKSSLKRMLEESDRIASTTKQQTRFATSLSFSPSIPPPRPPVKRLDKSLWSLYRTEKMVEDFRDEQLELFNENWSKFNDRASKCYYDQLNTWLSGKIFHPLAATIDKINQQIKDSNYSLADCPLDAMVMLMFQFDHSMFGLPIRLIHDALQIPGYDSIKARQYIIDRIKDLATGNKMAAYRYTPRQDDLPSDALILLHCFKTYLVHELPSVVPPLVPGEGDIFKFLLVYFYITDDLRDEIFELPIHK